MIDAMKQVRRIIYLIVIVLPFTACKQSALAPTLIWSVYGQDVTEQSQLHFELFQPAGVPILIRASGYEVEFELTTSIVGTKESYSTRTPYMRLGPQFQLLDKKSTNTTIRITVTAINFTRNAHVSVEAYSLSETDQVNRNQVHAYDLISDALASTQSQSTDLWESNVRKLREASQILERLDQIETRMWVDCYVSYFTYFPLYQYDEAIAKSEILENEAHKLGLVEIELLALQIQGQALIERNSKDSEAKARQKLLDAQSVFDHAIELAEKEGLYFEVAWLINNKGLGFHYADDFSNALAEYTRSKLAAANLSERFLFSLTDKNIVNIQSELDNPTEALERLERIYLSTPANNLPRQGRVLVEIAGLHRILYEFPASISKLNTALGIFEEIEDLESISRTQFFLAQAYIEVGNNARASELLKLSLVGLESANYGLGLYSSHRLLANIHRHAGEFSLMAFHRNEQSELVATDQDRALVLIETGKDFYSQGRLDESREAFERSENIDLAPKFEYLRVISELYLCLIKVQRELHCNEILGDPLLAKIKQIRNVKAKSEATYLLSQINIAIGNQDEAFLVLNDLIDDIHFYRSTIPGVLGAWFWENNKEVFETYIKLAADKHTQMSVNARESLNAIHKIKAVGAPSKMVTTSARENAKSLSVAREVRVLIAKMESDKPELSDSAPNSEIDSLILKKSSHIAQSILKSNSDQLIKMLQNMPENSALLSIYLFEKQTYVWLANKADLILKKLPNDVSLDIALERALKNFRYQENIPIQSELDYLGNALIGPIYEKIPETILFLPLGKLNGFPLDALRVDDHYLIEKHQVVNISSIDSINSLSSVGFLKTSTENIFLAGGSVHNDPELTDLPGVTEELANIRATFNTSGVFFANKDHLLTEQFQSKEASTADIIHIASHAIIDLNYPELSRILLNAYTVEKHGTAQSILTPSDVESGHYEAGLVVLSACQTSGINNFAFDSNLGFVHQFLDSGARMVMATLWPIPDKDTEGLIASFYKSLKARNHVLSALTNAKREHIGNAKAIQTGAWAAFQLYL